MSKPTVTVIPDALLERMAKAGYEEVVNRTAHLRDPGDRTWETETEALREDWRAIARAIHRSADERGSKFGAMMPFAACAVVLVLLGGSGIALWTAGGRGLPGLPGLHRASPALSKAEMIAPETVAPPPSVPAQEPTVPPLPSQSAAGDNAPAVPAAERPEPRKATCALDLDPWPADSTSQAKAIQILLRDLGFYGGTTYGTVGPATRAAIRQFQLASHETETGEPSRMLFDALQKKKCASSAPDASPAIMPPPKD